MSYFTKDEQLIINQAIVILDNKLKTNKTTMNSAFLVKNFLRLQMEHCQREHFSALYLDTQLQLLDYKVVFSGAVNSCTVSAREIVKDALALNSTAVILAHNHPSGNATPSRNDIDSTLMMRDALQLLDIKLIDHFVVGHNEINSLVELNLI